MSSLKRIKIERKYLYVTLGDNWEARISPGVKRNC